MGRDCVKIQRTENYDLLFETHKELFPSDQLEIDSQCVAWFLMDGNEIAGFCILKVLDYEIVFLHRAGIRKDYQGRGLQKRLIRVRERYARKIKASKIITYTLFDNHASSVNLLRCGYELYYPESLYAGHCLYWIKLI